MPDRNRDSRENLSLDEIEAREQEEKKQKNRLNIFSRLQRDGKGVDKDEIAIAENPNFMNFFKLVGRKVNEMLSVNLILVIGNFPIFFFLFAMSGYMSNHITEPRYLVYAPLKGAMLFHNSPAVSALWTLYSRTMPVTIHTLGDYIFMGLTLLLLVTFGPVRAGVTYLLRNMFRAKPVMILSDFWDALKRNLKQSLAVGVLDLLIIAVLIYDIVFFYMNYNVSLLMTAMFFLTLWMIVLYVVMRHYIWLMLVTFEIKITKIFKNALRFTVVGLKRNVMILLGTLFTAALEYSLLLIYFPLGVIFPFVILPSLVMMIGIYGAFPVIKKWMIDPYYEEA